MALVNQCDYKSIKEKEYVLDKSTLLQINNPIQLSTMIKLIFTVSLIIMHNNYINLRKLHPGPTIPMHYIFKKW